MGKIHPSEPFSRKYKLHHVHPNTGDGITCVSNNQCGSSPQCGANASCQTLGGVQQCVCTPGFSGDGQTCSDIDECQIQPLNTPLCHAQATCTNTQGTFRFNTLGESTFVPLGQNPRLFTRSILRSKIYFLRSKQKIHSKISLSDTSSKFGLTSFETKIFFSNTFF